MRTNMSTSTNIIDINVIGRNISYLERFYNQHHQRGIVHDMIISALQHSGNSNITENKCIKRIDDITWSPVPIASTVYNKDLHDYDNVSKYMFNAISCDINGKIALICDASVTGLFYLIIGTSKKTYSIKQILEIISDSNKLKSIMAI